MSVSLCPLLPPQTRLQAGVGYGNTFSCIRMVYEKERVSALGWVKGACQGISWTGAQATHLQWHNRHERACSCLSPGFFHCHMANATLPQLMLTLGRLVHCWGETGFV